MRKRNPTSAVEDFHEAVDDLVHYYERMYDGIAHFSDALSLLSSLAEQTLFTLAALWEAFVSDYFMSSINRDAEKFNTDLRERMKKSVKDRFGDQVIDYVRFTLPNNPSLETIGGMAARDERNLAFKDTESMISRASEWLSERHSSRFQALSAEERDTLDALIKIRNYVAHRSEFASEEMEEALKRLAQHPGTRDLGRGTRRVNKVGAYLKAWTGGGSRVHVFCRRVSDIADKLKPEEP